MRWNTRHPCVLPRHRRHTTPWPTPESRTIHVCIRAVDVFDLGSEHEQVVFANDPATGLKAIIAVHSTALGPALGGTRFHPYASTADALRDVLNLSRGMSYKAALAGLDLGGGKAVIIGDPTTAKSEPLLRAYGRHVAVARRSLLHRLRRRHLLGRHGRHRPRVLVRHRPHRRPRRRGRQLRAHGVRRLPGHARGRPGRVGHDLARRPHRRRRRRRQGRPAPGPAPGRGRRVGRRHRRVRPGARAGARGAPDGAGRGVRGRAGRLRSSTSTRRARWATRSPTRSSRCSPPRIVCGAANNQLAHPGVEKALEERGILYAPDYCVNAGGLIQVADELEGFSFERAQQRATGIFDTTLRVFELAASDGVPPADRRRPARRAADARGRAAARDVAAAGLRSRRCRFPRSAGETCRRAA